MFGSPPASPTARTSRFSKVGSADDLGSTTTGTPDDRRSSPGSARCFGRAADPADVVAELDEERGMAFERGLESVDSAMHAAKVFLMGVNRNMGGTSCAGTRLASFMFLAVIFGIEFDMFGFVFGAYQYWEYDNTLLKALMFFSMAGFTVPLIMLQLLADGMPSVGSGAGSSAPPRTPIGSPRAGAGDARGGNVFLTWLRNQPQPTNPFGGAMEFYHFVPIMRYYLLVKPSLDLTDVDAIFKVNTLSSFSLGIFQVMGIIATKMEGRPFTIYVWINVVSQAINWSLTVLYFSTSIASWMGRAGKAKSLSRFYDGLADHWSRMYAEEDVLIFLQKHGDEERKTLEREKKAVKDRLAARVCSAFAGADGRSIEGYGLNRMRDGDVKDFLQIVRDQAIAQLNVKNGQ